MSLQYEDTAEAEDEVDFEELLEDYELPGEGDSSNPQEYNEYEGERSYEASDIPSITQIPLNNRLQSRVSSQFSILLSEPDQFQDIVDSLPDDIVDELSDFWSNMERSYAYTTFVALEGISKCHDQLLSYPDTFGHELATVLEASDDRIQYADNFKYNFNRLRYSRRIEEHIKQILRERVNELIIKMDGVIEEKYSKSKRDAYKLLSKGFLRTESERMATLFGNLLQAQTDRFVDTVRFINGHYFKLIMEDLQAPIDLAWRSLVDICLLTCGGGPWANLPLLKLHENMGEGWGQDDGGAKSISYESTCSVDTCDICGPDGQLCVETPPAAEIKLTQLVSSHERALDENEGEAEGMESEESRGELGIDFDDEEEMEGEEGGFIKRITGSEVGLRAENSSGGEQGSFGRLGRRTLVDEEDEAEDHANLVSPTKAASGKSKGTGGSKDNKKKKGRKTDPEAAPPPPPPSTRKDGRKSKKLSEKPTQKGDKSKEESGRGSKSSRRKSHTPEFIDEEDDDDEEALNEMEGEDEEEEEEGGGKISDDILRYYEEYMGEGYWEVPMMNDGRGSYGDSRRGSRLSDSSKRKGASVDFNETEEYIKDSAYWDSDSSKATTTDRSEMGKTTVSCAEKEPYDDEEYYDFDDICYLRQEFYEKPVDFKTGKMAEICTPEPENLHFSIFGKDDDFNLQDSLLNKLLKRWGQSEPDEEEEVEGEQEPMELQLSNENGSSSKGKFSDEQEKTSNNKSQVTVNDGASSDKQVPNKMHCTFTSSVPPMSETTNEKKYSYVSSYSDGKWNEKVDESAFEPNPDETLDENVANYPPAKIPVGEKRPLIESLSTLQDEIWHEFEYAFRDVQLNVEKMVGIVQEIITQGYPADVPSEESLQTEETSNEEEEEKEEETEPQDPCKKKKPKKKRCKCSHKNKPPQEATEGGGAAEGKPHLKKCGEDSGGSKPGSKPESKSPPDGTSGDNEEGGGTGEEENSPEEEEADEAEVDAEEIVTTVTTHLEFPEEQESEGRGSGNFDMTKDPLYYKGEYLGEGFWEVEHSDHEETKEEDENDEEKEENDENDEQLERVNFNAVIRTKLQNWETTLQLEVERLRRHLMVIGIKAHEELNLFRELPYKVWERSKKQAANIYIEDLSRDVEVGDIFRCAIDSTSQLSGNFYIDTRDVKLLLNGTEPPIPLDYPESLRILPASVMEDGESSFEEIISAEEE
ncbi:Sperm flagellar protein 2 [Orchesella cincta]|uniref:Sperm flagellar protein 2 n=1 Tax=Orchesella cincta TaxID=48709 RepID=A0A1D2MGM3_ORCCI|nr:Sperm flagellar protein 2 [Orchesella cincta]